LAEAKTVVLLRFQAQTNQYRACQLQEPTDLVTGHFGIREPGLHCREIRLNQLDLVLVPGLAFDPRGRRLGRGKGYYDRVLSAARGVFCGVAFDQQIVGEVPVAPHDASVSCILTPTRWIVAV
jgi:5-formyltetrahydrofolate cyclo-ligase